MRDLSSRAGFAVTLLHLTLDDPYRFDRAQRTVVAAALGRAVLAGLRDTDMAFERGDTGWSFSVMLPLADPAQAAVAGQRLEQRFTSELPAGMGTVPLTLRYEALAGDKAPERARDG
jgi:hypothetical protein